MVSGKKIACSSCGRKFKTTAAMQQHSMAAHKGPQRTMRATARRREGGAMPTNVMSGTDIILSDSVPSGTVLGKNLEVLPLNPRKLTDTRLHQLSTLWARWRPKSLRLKVVCSGSHTTFGSLAIGWTPDANFTLGQGAYRSNLQQVASCRPSMQIRLNQTSSMRIPCETSRKWYNTSGAVDDVSHGSIAVVAAATTGGFSGSVSFALHLDWTCEFEGNELEVVASTSYITPDQGYIDLFTTSDGSWNSEILTFKMHHGGSMVPFSSAHPAKVYTVAGSTKVYYAAEDKNATRLAKYFVVIQGYTTAGFALVATVQDGKDYIRTGDTAKLLKYYTQGNQCTPSLLKFQEVDGVTQPEPDSNEVLRDEVASLRRLVKSLLAPSAANNRVLDSAVLAELRTRPRGTVTDPIKVFSEDPVRGAGILSLQSLSDSEDG